MPVLPAYKITQFFNDYKSEEVVFNKKIISQIGLKTNEVYINAAGTRIPCIIYSCSMESAKLVANLQETDFKKISENNNSVKLRFAFKSNDTKRLITFFVPSHVEGFNSFSKTNKSSFIITIKFLQKPSDDLIEILGKIIDNNKNIENRGDIRIPTNEETIHDIGLASVKGLILRDGKSAVCIIKNISITGALILTKDLTISKHDHLFFVVNTKDKVTVRIEAEVSRHETLATNKNICSLGIHFIPDKLPALFNTLINAYLDEIMKKQVFL